jgi:hypothetical protein
MTWSDHSVFVQYLCRVKLVLVALEGTVFRFASFKWTGREVDGFAVDHARAHYCVITIEMTGEDVAE